MKNVYRLIILLFCLFLLGCNKQYSGKPTIKAVDGYLDLTQWNFKADGLVKLNGGWEFYWQKLYDPYDFNNSNNPPVLENFIDLPRSWNNYDINGHILNGNGFATFRLKVKLPKRGQYGIKIIDFSTAYKVWINGRKLLKTGVVATNKENMVPSVNPKIQIFEATTKTLEIIVQISNYHHTRGGFWEFMLLGEESQILIKREDALALDLFLLGSFIIMFIYHFGFFMLRPKDKASLYFALLCFIISIRIAITGEGFAFNIYPDLSWLIHNKIEYITFYMSGGTIALLFGALFADQSSKKINIGILVVSVLFSLHVIFSDSLIYTVTIRYYQMFSLAIIIYVLQVIIRAIIKKEFGGLIALVGVGFIFSTAINDILFANEVISTGFYGSIGLFLFIVSYSLILSMRVSKAFNLSENLTASYGRFVPKEFLTQLGKTNILEVELGNQVQSNMSVLFSDIRSFTTLSESMNPQETFNFLNGYLKRMEPSIKNNSGIIDKYIGDAIMALFPINADDAIMAAISMQNTLVEYNRHRKLSGYTPIKIGIGINTGSVILGTVGALNRMEGTVISDAVNLSARIESMTTLYNSLILISDRTFRALKNPEQFDLRIIDQVVVKGKTEPITVFEVFNCDPQEIRDIKLSLLKTFEQAVAIYYLKRFEECLPLFKECLKQLPTDTVSQIYINRCKHYLKVGWDKDWNGVEKLATK